MIRDMSYEQFASHLSGKHLACPEIESQFRTVLRKRTTVSAAVPPGRRSGDEQECGWVIAELATAPDDYEAGHQPTRADQKGTDRQVTDTNRQRVRALQAEGQGSSPLSSTRTIGHCQRQLPSDRHYLHSVRRAVT